MLRLIADDNVISLTYQFETLSGSKSFSLQDAKKIRNSNEKNINFGLGVGMNHQISGYRSVPGSSQLKTLATDAYCRVPLKYKPNFNSCRFFNSLTKSKYAKEIDIRLGSTRPVKTEE